MSRKIPPSKLPASLAAEYTDTAGAAKRLGYKPYTMRRMRMDDEGPPYYRRRGLIVYRLKELDEWEKAEMMRVRILPKRRSLKR